ncbi:hypothetical protein, partial [Actinobacillus pleuropneumoniae]
VLIQVDIGVHPPIPLGSPTLSLSIYLIVAQFTIFGCFLGPKLQSHFEALNDIFFGKRANQKDEVGFRS